MTNYGRVDRGAEERFKVDTAAWWSSQGKRKDVLM